MMMALARVGRVDVVDGGLLDDRHEQLQARPQLLQLVGHDRQGLRVDLEAGVVQRLVAHRLAPVLEHVLVGVRLGRGEALLGDGAVLGDEPGRAAVVGRVDLPCVPDALGHEHVGERAALEDVDRHVLLAEVGQRLDVRIRLGVPVDDLRVDLERGDDRQHRRLAVAQDLALGVGVAEVDPVVGVLLHRHRLEADRRPARADLDAGCPVSSPPATSGPRTTCWSTSTV